MDRLEICIKSSDGQETHTYNDKPLGYALIVLMKHFPDFDTLMRAVVAMLDSHHPTKEEKPIRDALQRLTELERYARG